MPQVGDIREVSSHPSEFEWTINHFFLLPKHIGYSIASPIFSYEQHRCRLLALPNGTVSLPDVAIIMLTGIGKEGSVNWELMIYRTDFTLLRKSSGTKKDGCTEEMNMYIMQKEIERGCYARGYLRIICKLCGGSSKHLGIARREAASQTENTSKLDKLSQDLEELLVTGEGSDVTFRVKNQEIRAHKNIIAARNPVFASMFTHEMSEKISGIVDIEDCEPDAIRQFLHYLYSGRIEKFSLETVFGLHEVADKYQVHELKTDCLEFMRNSLSVDTFCDVIEVSAKYGEEEMREMATNFLSNNTTDIMASEKWQNFLFENPVESNKLLLEALRRQRTTKGD